MNTQMQMIHVTKIVKNIFCRNTMVNYYVKNDISESLYLSLSFLMRKYEYPIIAKRFCQREKFDGKCQYNIEFNFYESDYEHIEIKKHYNFSQNYLRISFYFNNHLRMQELIERFFYSEFKKYFLKENYKIIV